MLVISLNKYIHLDRNYFMKIFATLKLYDKMLLIQYNFKNLLTNVNIFKCYVNFDNYYYYY